MDNSQNMYHLYEYMKDTLKLMNQKIIPEKVGKALLKKLEPELMAYPNHMILCSTLYNFPENEYWYKALFKEDRKYIEALEVFTKSKHHNTEGFNRIVQNFLTCDIELRKEFYEKNFVKCVEDSRTKAQCLSVSGITYPQLNNNIDYNLPSMYLLYNKPSSTDLYAIIERDVKFVLGLNHEKYLSRFATGIVALSDKKFVLKNWQHLNMDNSPELKSIFALKLYVKKFDDVAFLKCVDDGLLPVDISLPRYKQYVMKSCLNNYLSNITYYFKTTPYDFNKIVESLNNSKIKVKELFEKYDLSFITPDFFEKHEAALTEAARSHNHKPEVNKEVLDYILEMSSIFNRQVEQKPKRQIKI